jgi:NitT/TauT family transport system ATP-binding protein
MANSHVAAAGPASEAPKASVTDVSVTYGTTAIIDRVSLDIRPNEIVCLIGPSGCGKTTMLHVFAGLIPPAAGVVQVDGAPIEGPGPDRVVVFQEDAVFPWMTVARNVAYGLRIKKVPPHERAQRVARLLELVGLAGTEDLFPRQLSGGMRKRVDMARALAVEPEILLMDEPYAALDTMTKERLQMEFLELHARSQTTALFVTHDLEEALFLGDRVAVMSANPGRIDSILATPFGRPRSVDLKRAPEFQTLRGDLTERLDRVSRSDGGS